MKNLIFVGGTMGAGKTAVGFELNKMLSKCVLLDGDWCWNSSPFVVTDETKAMMFDNASHLLNNFLGCSEFENVVFVWVMHEQQIIDDLLKQIDKTEYNFFNYSLTCSPEVLRKRLEDDVKAGKRTADVIDRSLPRLPLYDKVNSVKINTDNLSAHQAAKKIAGLICIS